MDELLLPKNATEDLDKPKSNKEFSSSDLVDTSPSPSLAPTTPHSSLINLIANLKQRRVVHRSHSAPSIFIDANRVSSSGSTGTRPTLQSTSSIVQQASIGIVLYIAIVVLTFIITSKSFKGIETFRLVDGLYFTMVTLSTIGYGDIVPETTFTKIFTCAFILVGFGFIDILLNGLLTYVLDRQEAVLLSAVDENRYNAMFRTYMIDTAKGRMRIRIKVCLALAVVVGCIATGTVMVHFLEEYNWQDSFYLTVTSVTTVGYGDFAFKTVQGRCFAIVWLLLSTLAVARAFLYLTELRIYKRNRKIATWVLQKKMTLGDLMAADLNNDGSISKSEYVVYKLREMGKVAEKDILQICNQFDRIDTSNCGKITLADLMEPHL